MTTGDEPSLSPDQVTQDRELARRNRERDLYYRRYEIEQTADEGRFDRSRQISASHASLALRTISVLNGGAIIAVPALAQIFDVVKGQSADLGHSIEMFVYGLIAAAVAMLCAYFFGELDCSAITAMMERKRKQLILDYEDNLGRMIADREQRLKEIDKDEDRRRVFSIISVVFQFGGLISGIISLVFFIVGALTAGDVFGV